VALKTREEHDMKKFNYVFSEIPNNEEGKELVRLMRKYLNKDTYNIRVKGQHLIDSEKPNWRRWSNGQPISLSKNLRVYIERNRDKNNMEEYIQKWRDIS
jgi:hypothetical protein